MGAVFALTKFSFVRISVRAQQTKPKKGPKRKFMNFALFVNSGVSPGKTNAIHIEFLFQFAGKVHELAFFWFGLPG